MFTGINACIPIVSLGKVEGESLAYDGVTGSSWYLQDTEFSGVCLACGSQPLCLSMGAVPGLAQTLVY